MVIEKKLKEYKKQTAVTVKEETLRETIETSKEIFALYELEHHIHYPGFLLGQLRLIRKRWWILQALLLGAASIVLPFIGDRGSMLKTLGVTGVLFVVLIIPEFWKNKSYDCMQVEGTCFYSLRQIYAARMLLFGMADTVILTGFYMILRGNLSLAAAEIMVQFLFPMLVAACICFGMLCSNLPVNEGLAAFLCLLWSAVWWMMIMNDTVYAAITFPMWAVMFGLALIFFTGAAYKTVNDCNQYWEVDLSGITNR